MYVTIVGAIGTWMLPAGKYNTLAYENNSFVVQTPDTTISLPFSQRTLDSLQILIPADKFKSGDIRKPVSIPGTYHRLPENHQGIINIIEAPIKGIYDTIDIILFVLFLGGFMNVFYHTCAL